MTTYMSKTPTHVARRSVVALLKQLGFGAHLCRVSARRVSFMDLARAERIIVTVHDWPANITPPTIKFPGILVLYNTGGIL